MAAKGEAGVEVLAVAGVEEVEMVFLGVEAWAEVRTLFRMREMGEKVTFHQIWSMRGMSSIILLLGRG
jgi:hypothetical protein